VRNLYHLGLFKTVNVDFEGDANNVDLVYELKEASARSVNLGGGYNFDDGVSVVLNYQDQNYGGVNDILSTSIGANQNDLLLDAKFVSPYRESDPDRLGYTLNAFRHGGFSPVFDDQIKLQNGDQVRERRLGGGASLQRSVAGWDASVGVNYTRTIMSDRHGNVFSRDADGYPLSWSGTGIDDLTTVFFSATHDLRDSPTKTTSGSLLSFTVEQSIPIGQGQIAMDRVRGNYSRYLPVQLFKSKRPQVLAINLQSGTVIGDLPPYDAFSLGGANSVRGYDWGRLGSGRSYVLTSAEYRVPVFPIAGFAIFADFGSDLGTGDTVLGNPAGVRGEPGTGFGYGAGLRIDSPLGLIRADYGIDNQGGSRVQLGIGEKF
jgi:outer membrane protein insertion porin family